MTNNSTICLMDVMLGDDRNIYQLGLLVLELVQFLVFLTFYLKIFCQFNEMINGQYKCYLAFFLVLLFINPCLTLTQYILKVIEVDSNVGDSGAHG
jgi:hypothetical protein